VRLICCVAALAFCALVAVDSTSRAQLPGDPRPWEILEVQRGLRTLTIIYETGGCWTGDPVLTVDERRRSIEIGVRQQRVVGPCSTDIRYSPLDVHLRRPVDGRPLEGAPRISPGALPPDRTPRVVTLSSADAGRALRVQGLEPRRLGRTSGAVAFQTPLAGSRLSGETVRLTVGRSLFRTGALDRCLEAAGIPTRVLVPGPGDEDAPDVDLLLRHRDAMASVALYADPVRARALEPAVRRNVPRRGVLERRRYATYVWYAPPAERRRRPAHGCIDSPLGRPRF
jgi:hypothetical protein